MFRSNNVEPISPLKDAGVKMKSLATFLFVFVYFVAGSASESKLSSSALGVMSAMGASHSTSGKGVKGATVKKVSRTPASINAIVPPKLDGLQLGCDLMSPSTSSQPVYIWVYAHHYVGGGGYYPRSADIHDALDLLMTLNIPATFFFDGILTKEIQSEGRRGSSLISQIKASSLLSIAYHGEETHGPFPVPENMLDSASDNSTYGLSWESAYRVATLHANFSYPYSFLDPLATERQIIRSSGNTLDRSTAGGLKHVLDTFGRIDMATTHGIGNPAAQQAFLNVANPDVLQGTAPLSAHSVPAVYADESVSLAGDDVDLIYHLGKLVTLERAETELPDSENRLCELKEALDALDRSRPRFVSYLIQFDPGNLSSLESALTWLRDTYLPANAGSKFVIATDLPDLVESGTLNRTVGPLGNRNLAQAVLNGFIDTAANRPPKFVSTSARSYTLAEAFYLLAQAANSISSTMSTTISTSLVKHVASPMGPIGNFSDLRGLSTSTSISVSDIRSAATKVLSEMGTNADSVHGIKMHVPYSIKVGKATLNSAEFLYALAAIQVATDTEITVSPMDITPPYADLLDAVAATTDKSANPLWYAKLQLWTVKPAPFK